MTLKAKWLGDGHCEEVTMGPYNIGGVQLPKVRFPAGKSVSVPDAFYGVLSGNALFEVDAPADKGDPRAAVADNLRKEIAQRQDELDGARADLANAKGDDAKRDAQGRVDAAQKALDDAKAKQDRAN